MISSQTKKLGSTHTVNDFYGIIFLKSAKITADPDQVGTHAQVKGRQCSQNFGRDQLSGGEMGDSKVSPTPRFFCKKYEMTF